MRDWWASSATLRGRACRARPSRYATSIQTCCGKRPPKLGCLSGLDSFAPQSHGCVGSVQTMQVETKYLRLCQPAALGEQIDGWKVYWVGGWGRDRLFFYVMVARAEEQSPKPTFAESLNH